MIVLSHCSSPSLNFLGRSYGQVLYYVTNSAIGGRGMREQVRLMIGNIEL
jgi:hypothetical protein